MRFSLIVALLLIGAAASLPITSDDELFESSGESSGEFSGESSGEGSGEVVVEPLTIAQLEVLNKYAQQVQTESQKVIHQANFVIAEMTALSANAQNLGILADLVLANSQIVLDNARFSLNESEEATTTTTVAPATCVPSAVCYNDGGCGSGQCVGALAGTCNCNSCVFGWPCQEDSACGGFIGACNSLTATCDCFSAYTKHNLTLTDALTNFCNVEKCNGAEDNVENCFGLPCNYGFCVC